jgi:hypothetical protein
LHRHHVPIPADMHICNFCTFHLEGEQGSSQAASQILE